MITFSAAHLARILATVTFATVFAACADADSTQPKTTQTEFPLDPANVWIYTPTQPTVIGGSNGIHTPQYATIGQDTAKVTETVMVEGRMGTVIYTYHIYTELTHTGVTMTRKDASSSAYAVDGGNIYALLDRSDSGSVFFNRWIKIADMSGVADWTALDTVTTRTVVSTPLIEHHVVTVARGGARTVNVKGVERVGQEYIVTNVDTSTYGSEAPRTYTVRTHYWFTPELGILAYKIEPDNSSPTEYILADYSLH